MELIVAIKDDIVVGLELRSNIGLECLEVGSGGENGAVVSAIVVRIDDCMTSSCGDEVDDSGQISQVGGVEGGSHCSLSKTLHEEGIAEYIHPLIHEDLD